VLKGHINHVNSAALSGYGMRVVSGAADESVPVELNILKGQVNLVSSLASQGNAENSQSNVCSYVLDEAPIITTGPHRRFGSRFQLVGRTQDNSLCAKARVMTIP